MRNVTMFSIALLFALGLINPVFDSTDQPPADAPVGAYTQSTPQAALARRVGPPITAMGWQPVPPHDAMYGTGYCETYTAGVWYEGSEQCHDLTSPVAKATIWAVLLAPQRVTITTRSPYLYVWMNGAVTGYVSHTHTFNFTLPTGVVVLQSVAFDNGVAGLSVGGN